ncbi:anti-sigma factor family protein [Longispora albida]|uniref:anti-sigma factor family protein n=1 Tax=Longispora albida TaxID=203523 RepID=UPI00038143DD|nr:zf-HC2 domain-containing protein [Longispora albida]
MTPLLGAYVLGGLADAERREVEEHLAGCAGCRSELRELEEVRDVLGDLPPEALLHGPPGADHVLERASRQVRAHGTRRRMFALAAAVVVLAGVAAGGVLAGRLTAPEPGTGPKAQPPATVTPALTPPPNRILGTTVDNATGVRLTVALTPAPGWVRVNVSTAGIAQGEDCRIVVVGKGGKEETAGGWVVSARGAAEGSNLDGSASVAPEDVTAVKVVNTQGTVLASVRF